MINYLHSIQARLLIAAAAICLICYMPIRQCECTMCKAYICIYVYKPNFAQIKLTLLNKI